MWSHSADVQVVEAGRLQPLAQEVLLDAGLCLEDGQGDGPSREEGTPSVSTKHQDSITISTSGGRDGGIEIGRASCRVRV